MALFVFPHDRCKSNHSKHCLAHWGLILSAGKRQSAKKEIKREQYCRKQGNTCASRYVLCTGILFKTHNSRTVQRHLCMKPHFGVWNGLSRRQAQLAIREAFQWHPSNLTHLHANYAGPHVILRQRNHSFRQPLEMATCRKTAQPKTFLQSTAFAWWW